MTRVITEDDLKHFQRNGARVRGQGAQVSGPRHTVAGSCGGFESRGAAPSPSRSRRYEYNGQVYKSKLEVRFAMHLDALKHAGEVARWQYEPVNFRLPGKKNFYCPDFLIEHTTCSSPVLVDTKGFNKSDDRSLVKIKTAAGLNRWATFKQVRWIAGAWIERVIEVN